MDRPQLGVGEVLPGGGQDGDFLVRQVLEVERDELVEPPVELDAGLRPGGRVGGVQGGHGVSGDREQRLDRPVLPLQLVHEGLVEPAHLGEDELLLRVVVLSHEREDPDQVAAGLRCGATVREVRRLQPAGGVVYHRAGRPVDGREHNRIVASPSPPWSLSPR